MFNYRSAESNVRVLRRIWYAAEAQELRSHWVVQRTAPSETRAECNETVISVHDTGIRCK
jgi:hypothetical protein